MGMGEKERERGRLRTCSISSFCALFNCSLTVLYVPLPLSSSASLSLFFPALFPFSLWLLPLSPLSLLCWLRLSNKIMTKQHPKAEYLSVWLSLSHSLCVCVCVPTGVCLLQQVPVAIAVLLLCVACNRWLKRAAPNLILRHFHWIVKYNFQRKFFACCQLQLQRFSCYTQHSMITKRVLWMNNNIEMKKRCDTP